MASWGYALEREGIERERGIEKQGPAGWGRDNSR